MRIDEQAKSKIRSILKDDQCYRITLDGSNISGWHWSFNVDNEPNIRTQDLQLSDDPKIITDMYSYSYIAAASMSYNNKSNEFEIKLKR